MPISVVFDPPLPSDSPSTFNTKAFTLLGDLNDWSTQANALPGEVATNLSALLAAPPAIGGTTPAAGSFTTLSASGNVNAGLGLTGANNGRVVINGGASSSFGAQLLFNRDGVNTSQIGQESGINGGTSNDLAIYPGAANLNLYGGGIKTAVVSSSGLAVTGALSATGDFSTIGGSGYKYIRFHSASDSNSIRTAKIGKNYDSPWDLDIHASTGTSGSFNEAAIKFYKNNTDVVATLDSSGNLGIGVTPSAWDSGGNIDGQNDFTWSSYDGSIGSNYYYNSGYKYKSTGAPVSRYAPYNGAHTWFTAPSGTAGNPISFTQAMTLTAGGRLSVDASTSASSGCHAFQDKSASPNTIRLYNDTDSNTTTNRFLICDAGASVLRAEIRSNGGLANFSANNVNLSDVRTKKNIQDAGNYLAKICAIPVRTFLYKDQTDNHLNLGAIAQEVEAQCPELVSNDGFGDTPADGVPLKSIYQTDMQYALMKCIQEQQALIESLAARVAQLEG